MDDEALQGRLADVEFVRLNCTLRCEQQGEVRLPECLALRPVIVQAARDLVSLGGLAAGDAAALFDPHFGSDAEGRRRFQKPAPPFVFRYRKEGFRHYRPGETLTFELLLMGKAIAQLPFFIRLLELLAERAFGETVLFELTEVEGWDDSENLHPVWLPGDELEDLMPPVCTADWWVMRHAQLSSPLRLTFSTPARLMARGKPLFRPDFRELFPFLLRRVTSLCYAHADQLLVDDVRPLLEMAAGLDARCLLRWEDWRPLRGGAEFEVGGLLGGCDLQGERLAELCWVLALAELFQVGRGAAYGAGKIELSSTLPG